MAFGKQPGPPASHQQLNDLLELLRKAGHADFRDARGPMGFTQRQAGGKFTRDEAEQFIFGQRLQIGYRFALGARDDGVTVSIPKDLLARIDDDQLGWLVPGLLEEKLVALIRVLPKPLRRLLVPAPDTARRL